MKTTDISLSRHSALLLLALACVCGCRSPLEHRRDFAIGAIRELASRDITVRQIEAGDACEWEFHFTARDGQFKIQGPIIASYAQHCSAKRIFHVLTKTMDQLQKEGGEVTQFDYTVGPTNYLKLQDGTLTLTRARMSPAVGCCLLHAGAHLPAHVPTEPVPVPTVQVPPAVPVVVPPPAP